MLLCFYFIVGGARAKWKNLKDTYIKVKKNMKEEERSGSAGGKKKKKKWMHWDAMHALMANPTAPRRYTVEQWFATCGSRPPDRSMTTHNLTRLVDSSNLEICSLQSIRSPSVSYKDTCSNWNQISQIWTFAGLMSIDLKPILNVFVFCF